MKMRSIITAVVAVLWAGVTAHAGFVVTTTRAPITSGEFQGNDGVTLFIQNDGVGTTDPTFGADLIYYQVGMSAPQGTVNPQFFIHTWNGTIHSTLTPATNTLADFGMQGFLQGDANRDGVVNIGDVNVISQHFNASNATWDQGDLNGDKTVNIGDVNLISTSFNKSLSNGSYVRFGTNAQFNYFFILPPTTPAENSQTYTDLQSVTGFSLSALVLSQNAAGLPDSTATQLAYAVVPTGQSVTFTGQATGHTGPTTDFTVTRGAAYGGPFATAALIAVPEPTALGLLSIGVVFLRRRRR